jgi:hypothetical protein
MYGWCCEGYGKCEVGREYVRECEDEEGSGTVFGGCVLL